MLYESAEVLYAEDGDVLVPLADNPRLPAAQAAARRKSLVPLTRMLAMSQGEFMKRPNITYTQAGSLMLYLRDVGRLRKFYDAYKETYDADPTGRAALEKASGTPLEEFEAAWVKWLLDRPATPFFGTPTLFLGARVAPGGGGLTVITVAPNGPASDAGIEPRDVIVSVNGQPVKEFAALRPAIGKYTPGQRVKLRSAPRGQGVGIDRRAPARQQRAGPAGQVMVSESKFAPFDPTVVRRILFTPAASCTVTLTVRQVANEPVVGNERRDCTTVPFTFSSRGRSRAAVGVAEGQRPRGPRPRCCRT